MEKPYLGEIRVFAFSMVPEGWAPCDGRSLSISQYPDLAKLLGGAFGPFGSSFNLPDLRGRTPIGVKGQIYPMGKSGGEERVLPKYCVTPHNHALCAVEGEGAESSPSGNMLCILKPDPQHNSKLLFSSTKPSAESPRTLADGSVSETGGSAAHNNMQPSLVLNFCIALTGINPQDSGQR